MDFVSDLITEIGQADNRTMYWVAFIIISMIVARMAYMQGRDRDADNHHRDKLLEQFGSFQETVVALQTANHNLMSEFLKEQKLNREDQNRSREIQKQYLEEQIVARQQRKAIFDRLSTDMAAQTGVLGENTQVVRQTKEAIELTGSQIDEVKHSLTSINTALNTVVQQLQTVRDHATQIEALTKEMGDLNHKLDEMMSLIKGTEAASGSDDADQQTEVKGDSRGRTDDRNDIGNNRGTGVAEATRPETTEGKVQPD